jgi:3-oxoacyl-[acyl-carrier protein] reductase
MQFDFKDQTAIVTGGTRGIGRAVSQAFLAAGGFVVATYRGDDPAAEAFARANRAHEARLSIKKFDVGNYAEVEAFFRDREENGGPFQVVVHSSGVRKDAVVGLMKEDDWNRVIQTNLTGTFNVCKLAVQGLMRQRYGRIVVVTSPIGRFGFAGQSNYAASKAGQVAFVRSLSKEVATRGITVNCVSPGFIETDFIADLPEKQKKAYLGMVPMKRFGQAGEVASSVLFLASREAAYITGSVQEISGGL